MLYFLQSGHVSGRFITHDKPGIYCDMLGPHGSTNQPVGWLNAVKPNRISPAFHFQRVFHKESW